MVSFFANIPEQKKQKYLIVIFCIISVITFIVFREYFRKPEIPSIEKLSMPQYKEPEISFQTLDNPLLRILRPFEKIPPLLGPPGRENPFLPF